MKSFIEDGSTLKNDALDLEGAETQQPKLDSETKQVRIFILKILTLEYILLIFFFTRFHEIFQVVRMLISIVLTFIICWAPLLIFNVLHAFAVVAPDGWHNSSSKHLKSIFSLLAYCNR